MHDGGAQQSSDGVNSQWFIAVISFAQPLRCYSIVVMMHKIPMGQLWFKRKKRRGTSCVPCFGKHIKRYHDKALV